MILHMKIGTMPTGWYWVKWKRIPPVVGERVFVKENRVGIKWEHVRIFRIDGLYYAER